MNKFSNSTIQLPITISLIRIAPRSLDKEDNLPASMKFFKDYIADYLIPGKAAGRADDSDQLAWKFGQEKGKPKEYALRVSIDTILSQ